MNIFIKIAFLSLSINLFYTQTTLAQSKVFNNVYNDYSYIQNYVGNTYYNNEYFYSINEFDTNIFTIYGNGRNLSNIIGGNLYAYQYMLDIDNWGDTLLTKRLNLNPESDLEASYSGIRINNSDYIIGITNDINLSYFENVNAKIIKLDNNQDTIWTREYNMGDDNKFVTIKTNDNGTTFQVLGFADVDTAGINYDAFISTIDSNGNLISNIQLGGSENDFLYAIEYLDNGNYLVCGHTFSYSTGGGADIWLLEIQPNGVVIWQKTFGNQYYDRINNSKGMIIKGNNIYIAGRSGEVYPNIAPSVVGYLIKTDMQGNSLWEKKYVKGERNEEFMGLQSFDDETLIIGGQTSFYSDTAEYPIGWILKVDTNGNTIWERTVQKYTPADNNGSAPHHYVYDMLVSSDKGILFGGYVIANYITDDLGYYPRNDAWLAKTDSCGYTVGDIPSPFLVIDSIKHTKESHQVFITEQSQDYCTAELDWGDGSALETYYAYENNQPLGEKQLNHFYTQNGTYTIKTTTLAGEEYRSYETDIAVSGIAVGIDDVVAEQGKISLFPKPANDYVIVQNPNSSVIPAQAGISHTERDSFLQRNDGSFKMTIHSLNGKQVESINLNPKLYQQKIDISDLNNGVYFVRFMLGEELIGTEKLVVAR